METNQMNATAEAKPISQAVKQAVYQIPAQMGAADCPDRCSHPDLGLLFMEAPNTLNRSTSTIR